MVSITNANIKIGFIIGIVICIILRNAFAPSIAAASLTDSSIVVLNKWNFCTEHRIDHAGSG